MNSNHGGKNSSRKIILRSNEIKKNKSKNEKVKNKNKKKEIKLKNKKCKENKLKILL